MGYPITYAIVRLLLEKGPMDLDAIVRAVKRKKSTVCGHLSKLRLANIIRYDKTSRETIYFIKYPDELNEFVKVCERTVLRITRRLKKDY